MKFMAFAGAQMARFQGGGASAAPGGPIL